MTALTAAWLSFLLFSAASFSRRALVFELPLGATPVRILRLSSGVKLTKPPPSETPRCPVCAECWLDPDDLRREAARLCGWEACLRRVKRGWGLREGEREGGFAGPWPMGMPGVVG